MKAAFRSRSSFRGRPSHGSPEHSRPPVDLLAANGLDPVALWDFFQDRGSCYSPGGHLRPPLFIPGMGALILLREHVSDPVTDARIGLAGPVWGLSAAVAAWVAYLATGRPSGWPSPSHRIPESVQSHPDLATRWLARVSRALASGTMDGDGCDRRGAPNCRLAPVRHTAERAININTVT